jgi:hypothetical protein
MSPVYKSSGAGSSDVPERSSEVLPSSAISQYKEGEHNFGKILTETTFT